MRPTQIRDNNMITIAEANVVLGHLPNEFDSHDFIEKYISLYERPYVNMLVEKIDNQGIFQTVNSMIARFIEDNKTGLGVTKDERIKSQNVKGNYTENQKWIKKNYNS